MKAIGTANAWFSFAGHKNTEYGVHLLSMPTRPHPARKGTLLSLPAADGKFWQDDDAYDQIVIPICCITLDNANIDTINAWLSGKGNLIFGDEPQRVYHAQITKEFSRSNRSQRLRGQEFTVSFDCEPYRYNVNAANDAETINESGTSITNPGTVASAPLLKVTGTGEATLMIGQNTLLFSSFPAPIYVDCEAKIAYTGTGTASDPMLLATQYVTGEWMRIEPGANFVSFTSGITSVEITPRWRWL